MSYYRVSRPQPSFSYGVSPVVMKLLVATGIVFLLQNFAGDWIWKFGAFTPALAVYKLMVWQFFTYMFMHGGFFHILFNMLIVWMFGTRLEQRLGGREFLRFYLICGAGAALVHFIACLLFGFPGVPMIGASGAVYGILLASAVYWGQQVVYVYGIFPMKLKYLVLIMGGLALWASISMVTAGSGGNIAHFAHLGGLLTAWLYLRFGGLRKVFRFPGGGSRRRRDARMRGPHRPFSDDDTWR